MNGWRVVSPYRPFRPETAVHRLLDFDWIDALRMLAASVSRSCHVPVIALTDLHTDLPVPAYQLPTTATRLMLWILEVSLRYLESPHFDRDTILITPDILVYSDLQPYFTADLGILVRTHPKFARCPILNGVQWWRHRAKDALVAFYTQALALARTLPEPWQRWGGDTEPLRLLLDPIVAGEQRRHGLQVAMVPSGTVMESLTTRMVADMRAHGATWPPVPIVDFKLWRKREMRAYYDATWGGGGR